MQMKATAFEHICAHPGQQINPVFVKKGRDLAVEPAIECRVVLVVCVNLFGR
jgi:hypothetical protein